MSPRRIFVLVSGLGLGGIALTGSFWWEALLALPLLLPVVLMGSYDMLQTRHTIRRNFPFLGRFRYWFEAVRPEIRQYFIESNSSGRPFSRELRSLVYRRAKNVTDTLPFGTEYDVYAIGYQWMNHSLCALEPPELPPRVRIGGPRVQGQADRNQAQPRREARPWRHSAGQEGHARDRQDRELMNEPVPKSFARAVRAASATTFEAAVKD